MPIPRDARRLPNDFAAEAYDGLAPEFAPQKTQILMRGIMPKLQ